MSHATGHNGSDLQPDENREKPLGAPMEPLPLQGVNSGFFGMALKNYSFAYPLFLILLTGLVYVNSLQFPFVWDDTVFISQNSHLQKTSHISEYFTESFCKGAAKECAFYRPLMSLSYLGDFLIYGKHPLGFHLTNVILHMGAVLLFYGVSLKLFQRPRASLIAGLLFAVHPVHSESVAFVAARTDPLASISLFISFFCFDRYLRSWGIFRMVPFFLSLLFFGLGLLTKEMVITLPLMLLLYDVMFVRLWNGWKDFLFRWPTYFPFGVVILFYFKIRHQALGYGLTQDLKWNELGIRLATVPALIWDYFRLQIIPYPLMIFHERPTLFGSPWAGIFWGMIFLFLFLLFLYRLFPFSKVGVFGGIWFLVTLLPILNIIPIPWPTVVERFSYIPSFGFVLMIGVAGNYLMNHLPLPPLNIGKRGWVKMFVGVLMIFSVLTVMRNRVWSDEILIWKDTVNKSPHFALGHMNLGLTYHERGELQEAESAYQKALTLTSSSPKLLHNFGRLYQDTGRPEKAFNLYQRLAAQGDAFPETYLNMAILFEEKKEPDQAVHFYEKALEKDPGYFKAHLRLGRLLEYQKNLEGALAHYREAIGIFPMRYKVYFDIAEVLRLLGRFNEAGEAFSQFIRRVPADQKGSKEYAYAQMRVNEILNKQP